jgi:hypothetical protein
MTSLVEIEEDTVERDLAGLGDRALISTAVTTDLVGFHLAGLDDADDRDRAAVALAR